jgi:CheY-like chemotaxis protein
MMTSSLALPSKTEEYPTLNGLLGEHAQTVVIVNGTPEVLASIETAVEAGRYGVVFIESIEHAYTQIKRVQPNLVILCVRLHEMNGFHVLSMLKLDEATRGIPVVTYAAEEHQDDEPQEDPEPPEVPFFEHRHLELMN